jgi:hypothetical protein
MSNNKQIKKHRCNRISVDDLYEKQTIAKIKNATKNKGFVYFIVNYEQKVCKIGYSLNPEKRLKEIQTCYPYRLIIHKKVVGDLKKEKWFHKVFSRYKTKGEWFRIEGDLKDYIYKGHFSSGNN